MLLFINCCQRWEQASNVPSPPQDSLSVESPLTTLHTGTLLPLKPHPSLQRSTPSTEGDLHPSLSDVTEVF